MSVTTYPMIHYYTAPATREVVEYLRNGCREFYTKKNHLTQTLTVCFLATEDYVAKMKARTFLRGVEINKKA